MPTGDASPPRWQHRRCRGRAGQLAPRREVGPAGRSQFAASTSCDPPPPNDRVQSGRPLCGRPVHCNDWFGIVTAGRRPVRRPQRPPPPPVGDPRWPNAPRPSPVPVGGPAGCRGIKSRTTQLSGPPLWAGPLQRLVRRLGRRPLRRSAAPPAPVVDSPGRSAPLASCRRAPRPPDAGSSGGGRPWPAPALGAATRPQVEAWPTRPRLRAVARTTKAAPAGQPPEPCPYRTARAATVATPRSRRPPPKPSRRRTTQVQ